MISGRSFQETWKNIYPLLIQSPKRQTHSGLMFSIDSGAWNIGFNGWILWSARMTENFSSAHLNMSIAQQGTNETPESE